MKLSNLFGNIEHERIGEDVDVANIVYDSRMVSGGDLFCCVIGLATDGHEYAAMALDRGAVALLVQSYLPLNVTQILVKDSRKAMALAACEFFGHPSQKMTMVGITGTNGKTTTSYMMKAIATHAGIKTGLIGTIANLIGDRPIPTERTTPESVDLQRLLATMVCEDVKLCVMEVSSHSLEQFRVEGITFHVGVFTNLTQDHLDYHKTWANYKAAKRKLFVQSKVAIVNIDDAAGVDMIQGVEQVRTFGIRENADVYAKEIEVTTAGVCFTLRLEKGVHIPIKLNIPGLFSVYNAIGAAGACRELNISTECIAAGLSELTSVSGRLERLYSGKRGTVLLDYAHTPDALENILKTVRGFAKGKIFTLFGCGGDRDRAKRPIMGETAGRYSDMCIITSDNPRTENPDEIIKSIEEGVSRSGCDFIIIENRRDAIAHALTLGLENDIVILAGKGHETYQEINGIKTHFDEKEIVAEMIARLDGNIG